MLRLKYVAPGVALRVMQHPIVPHLLDQDWQGLKGAQVEICT